MIRILGDRVLLTPLPVQTISAGGIMLPQGQTGDKMMYWRVDQIGTGKVDKKGNRSAPEFNVGQTVVTLLYFSHHTLEDGSGRKIVDCEHVIAKVE